MDGFIELLRKISLDLGVPEGCIFTKGNHLPGFFRPTKNWDFLILSPSKKLIAIAEFKSQVGSFGNNFNNRTEEALGNAVDLWTAFREKVYPNQQCPWLGYLMLVERSEKSTAPIGLAEPHLPVMKEFKNTSYLDRYQLLCQKLLLERHYSATCLLWTENESTYGDTAEEISYQSFVSSFIGHIQGQKHEFSK